MQKRKIIIGTYDTALDGLWTLAGWSLSRAEAFESYVDVPGHSGPLDLSTALSDGEPYYGSRTFEAVLENSEGTRLEREDRINRMINTLDGWRLNIVLPDDPYHYITGRVRVEKLYNDLAHASVRVSATCDPWRYNNAETVVVLTATTTAQTVSLINSGRLSVVPSTKITGGSVTLTTVSDTGEYTKTLDQGVWPFWGLYLKTGTTLLRYSGAGQVTLTYREAVL